jgi:hypothetical protein
VTKQEEFLWIVQTTILANNIRLATEPDTIKPKNDNARWQLLAGFSTSPTFSLCTDAVYASRCIPGTMSAETAAHQWVFWMLENLRDGDAKLPTWFARG